MAGRVVTALALLAMIYFHAFIEEGSGVPLALYLSELDFADE